MFSSGVYKYTLLNGIVFEFIESNITFNYVLTLALIVSMRKGCVLCGLTNKSKFLFQLSYPFHLSRLIHSFDKIFEFFQAHKN